jgi:hypothetical protein
MRAITRNEFNLNNSFRYARGELRGFANNKVANLVVPATIWDDPVISIGKEAFKNAGLTAVTIGNGVISIGESAFKDNKITLLIFSGNNLASIGKEAFRNNELTSVTIGDGVISIGEAAFKDNKITRLIFSGNNLTSIGDETFADAFSGNVVFKNFVLPQGLTSIGKRAFLGKKMESVTIPNSVRFIDVDAFRLNGEIYLKTIIIGSNVELKNDPFLSYTYLLESGKWVAPSVTRFGFLAAYEREGKKGGTYTKKIAEPWKYKP